MPALAYTYSAFTTLTKIQSGVMNQYFTDIKTLLNTTKLDSTNIQDVGITQQKLATVIQTKTTTYSILSTDDVVLCSGSAFTVTLPAASSYVGKKLKIKKTDASLTNIITVSRAGSDTIQDNTTGLTSTTLNTIGETIELISDGTSVWQLVSRSIPNQKVSFTPTGSWSSNSTYTGFYTRLGDSIQAQVQIALSGAPTSASLTLNLPSGLSVDTSKVLVTSANDMSSIGLANFGDAGSANYVAGKVVYNDTSSVAVRYSGVSGASIVDAGAVSQSAPFTFGNADFVNAVFTVPISGWNA